MAKQNTNTADLIDVTITDLAYGGDGRAQDANGQPLLVPYGLPGDTLRVKPMPKMGERAFARVMDVIKPADTRVHPVCAHFFACGGCALQHLRFDAYQAWKVSSVMDRLERANLRAQHMHPLVTVPPQSRRRATFCARRAGKKIVLGFNRMHSAEVIDIAECHVLVPEIMELLPGLRHLMDTLLGNTRTCDVGVTVLDTGLDILLTGEIELNLLMREALAEFVVGHPISRVSLRTSDRAEAEVILSPKQALLSVGGTQLTPVPGSFLQPSREGEAALIDAVRRGVGGAKNVIDLFAGLGTFTWPLSNQARVHAVDADGPAIRAVMAAEATRNVTAAARNLYKDPVRARDLEQYDAIVFDPPRAGAKGQGVEIAASHVKTVVAVSCNPGTFIVDAEQLVAAGYRFAELTIVDQFVWSSHIELVAAFKR